MSKFQIFNKKTGNSKTPSRGGVERQILKIKALKGKV